MKNFLIGLGVALVISVGVANSVHTRQNATAFATQIRTYGEFMPDAYVTDGPSYLRFLDGQKEHSAKFWADINQLGTQGWEPVSTSTTVAQFQT